MRVPTGLPLLVIGVSKDRTNRLATLIGRLTQSFSFFGKGGDLATIETNGTSSAEANK